MDSLDLNQLRHALGCIDLNTTQPEPKDPKPCPKSKERILRPGLQTLNALNNQLQSGSQNYRLVARIKQLEGQNYELKQAVMSLSKQLEVQKKLRKYVEKENPKFMIMDPQEIHEITRRLAAMKGKYHG